MCVEKREVGGGVPQLPSMICRPSDTVRFGGTTRLIPSASGPVNKVDETARLNHRPNFFLDNLNCLPRGAPLVRLQKYQ